MLNMNVNINECTEIILNYSKDILDWLTNNDIEVTKENLKDMVDSSILYSDMLCKDYLYEGFNIQAAVNQKCMSLILTECYIANYVDKDICIKKLNDNLNSTENQNIIIQNAIKLIDEMVSVAYKIIGINRFSNKLYIQHVKSSEYFELSGRFQFRQCTKFLITAICKINKDDMYITDSYNKGNYIIYFDLIKTEHIDKLEYGDVINILKDTKYYNIRRYSNNKKDLILNIYSNWKDIDRLNSPNAVIYITDSTELAKKIQNLIGRECTILNTFGVKEDELPDIIFDDIVVIDHFNFTTDQIKEKTYNSIPCSYIHEDVEIEGELE